MIISPVSCYEPPLQVQLLTLRRYAASYSYTYTGALHPVRLSIDGSRSGNEAPLSGSPSREITMHLTRSFLDPPIPEDRRLRDLANAPKCRPRREAAAFYLRQSRSPFENLKASILSAAERHVNGDVEMSSQISGRHPERSGIELVRSTSEGRGPPEGTKLSPPKLAKLVSIRKSARQTESVCSICASVRPWNITYQQQGRAAREAPHRSSPKVPGISLARHDSTLVGTIGGLLGNRSAPNGVTMLGEPTLPGEAALGGPRPCPVLERKAPELSNQHIAGVLQRTVRVDDALHCMCSCMEDWIGPIS